MGKLTFEGISQNLKSATRPLKVRELAHLMNIDSENYSTFRRIVKEAVSAGKLARTRGGRLTVNDKQNVVEGRLHVNRAGHGFVLPVNKTGEIFISRRDMGGALHGESVKVVVKDTRTGKNREGRIIQVVDREKGRLVGRLFRSRYGYYIIPNDRRYSENIEVENARKLPLANDLMVTVRLYPWQATYLPARGFVEEILGEVGAPGMEIDSIVAGYGFPKKFDQSVNPELAKIRRSIARGEISRRQDFRNLVVFAIDPSDAKDHDDAISLEPLGPHQFRLGVHIADVSYYVKEGSALDREARSRGNSVYLVDRVIPMLPEKLSSDICSLVDGEDRLTVSFTAEIDEAGHITDWMFAESIIQSRATLTYDEVQDYFDRKGRGRIDVKTGKVLESMLKLSQTLRQQRLEMGSLDFDLPEPQVLLDSEGNVIDIFSKARMPSHQVVEEFMLVANKFAATFLESRGAPILYRVHARPDKEKIANFAALLNEMGYNFSFRGDVTPKKLQRVLEVVKDKPEESFVEEILLRSLAKAVYQPENIGHFGLAFQRYTHFTSPIRRYPDLLVHRVLKKALNGKLTSQAVADLKATLKTLGAHCTATEITADEAERDSIKVKQLEYLVERVGGVYDGIISGVVKAGVFVELMGSMVEGFVPFATIHDDYFVLDEGKHRASGRRTGRVFKLGDKVRVIIDKVDLENKRADFALVNNDTERKAKKK